MQYLKADINKQEFIKIYLDFLKGQDLIPLDIINAKIEIIDFLYVPYYAEQIKIESLVSAQIGDYEKRYKEKVWNKDLKQRIAEEYTETVWHSEDFPVRSSIDNIICINKDFFSIVSENFLTLNQNLISAITASNEKYKLLEINLDENTKENKRNSLIDKEMRPLIQRELRNRGDDYKNASWETMPTTSYEIGFYLPVGYVKYNYNGKSYYFIISLYNGVEEEIKITTPVDKESESKINKNKNIFSIIFWSYLLLAGLIYYLATMTNFAHIYPILWATIIVLTADLMWLEYKDSQNYKENISKRKHLLDKIFETKADKLIDLVSNLEKPYKEGSYE